ncbi:MAG: hypothetical protein AUF63_00480 [Candidatus Rokubacteria bacterium 13_1_20CM_70_15]|nr:MAG: hypothetical protein AUF63_00480 [Candidatus Rokubacteria bacterium 13_1_20CM_70_15]
MEGTREQETVRPALQRALGGRYVLERRLGRGGMGLVYLAREPRLARRVAIKVLPPDRALQPAARERFLREARTAAGLSHPNIVPIFAVDEAATLVFFVMAYVEGETLGQRIRTRGPLPPAEVARVLKQVARALAYAHDHGVVHRDVKPDNILLENPTGRVLVTDFGIARVGAGGGTTGPREVVGTAEFMSPEQASGGVVDRRSDLYSLGVVAYYALSGRLPFEERDAYVLMARPAVPRQLARTVDRCLAKAPSARFAGGSELVEAIDHAARLQAAPPIAVRAFLVESRHLSGPSLVYATLAGLAVPLLAASFSSGETLATKLLAAGGVAWVLLFPVGYMVRRVRRLFAAGYEREDLVEALEAALERRREELAFLYGEGPSGFERTLRRLSYAALGAAAAAVGLHLLEPAPLPDASLFAAFGVSALAALLAAIVARARTEHRTDPKAERRLRFWRGPLGRWLCRVAGLRLHRDPAAAQQPVPTSALPPEGERSAMAAPAVTAPYRPSRPSVAPPPP